jgi:hypothetical protein
VANAQGSIETASWQHLADQWFQAMARSPGLGEATLRDSSGSETVGRVLTGQRMLPPSASDDLDVVDWQEAGGEVNRPGMAPWNLCGRRDAASRGTSPAAVAPFATERAALDQVFSQATDDTDSIVVED